MQARNSFGLIVLTSTFSVLGCTGRIELPEGADPGFGTPASGDSTAAGASSGSGGSAGSTGGSASGGAGGSLAPDLPVWTASVGRWCGPGDNATLWLVANPVQAQCAARSEQIYGEDESDGLRLELTTATLTTLPATLTLPARYCAAGTCSTLDASVTIESYTEAQGATGTWSVTPPGAAKVEGRLLADWCTWDDFLPAHPEGDRLARDVSISEVAVYQGVKVPIMADMQAVAERNADLVQNREALVRIFVEPGAAFASREIQARLTLSTPGADPVEYEASMTVSGASNEPDLGSTYNLTLPKDAFQEGTQYSVELRETSQCTELAGTPAGARFPETGLVDLGAVATGPVKVMLVPVRYDTDGSGRLPDTSPAQLEDMSNRLYAMYPTTEVTLTVREPVGTNYSDLGDMLNQMQDLREDDSPPSDVAYYGMVSPAETFNQYCNGSCTTGIAGYGPNNGTNGTGMGIGFLNRAAGTFVHEIGHVYRRPHAPCGGPASPDPNYPYDGALIGSWGYDLLEEEFFDPEEFTDFMSYCSPDWISDYNYQLLVERVILVTERANAQVVQLGAPEEWRSLIVDGAGNARWGVTLKPKGPPPGDPMLATVLDAQGVPLLEVIAYHQETGHESRSTYFVPVAKAGWHSIQVPGIKPHPYSAPVTVTPFTR